MICQFSFKGSPVYVRASSIVALMPDSNNPLQTVVFTEPPLDSIVIDEEVDDAFAEWYTNLNDIEEMQEEFVSWADVAIEV